MSKLWKDRLLAAGIAAIILALGAAAIFKPIYVTETKREVVTQEGAPRDRPAVLPYAVVVSPQIDGPALIIKCKGPGDAILVNSSDGETVLYRVMCQ